MTAELKKWIHMVGIAGAGMSGIARVLLEQGMKVSGSDLQFSSTVANLQQAGIIAYQGHSSANMDAGGLHGVDLCHVAPLRLLRLRGGPAEL